MNERHVFLAACALIGGALGASWGPGGQVGVAVFALVVGDVFWTENVIYEP